jgi:hypothetical protein
MNEMRQDERRLWQAFGDNAEFRWPRDAGDALGMSPLRVDSLCMKWSREGIYEYGTCSDLGWKTTEVVVPYKDAVDLMLRSISS